MSSSGHKPESLTEQELKKLLLEAVGRDTNNPESLHALFHHLERGIQTDDVLYGLASTWKRFQVLRFNEDFWQWNYQIETENVDERSLTIVVAVDTANREFEVITRWTNDESGNA